MGSIGKILEIISRADVDTQFKRPSYTLKQSSLYSSDFVFTYYFKETVAPDIAAIEQFWNNNRFVK